MPELEMIRDEMYRVTTAGLPDSYQMTFRPGVYRCGDIKDGVSLDIGEGGWVISFESLAEMYELACEARGQGSNEQ